MMSFRFPAEKEGLLERERGRGSEVSSFRRGLESTSAGRSGAVESPRRKEGETRQLLYHRSRARSKGGRRRSWRGSSVRGERRKKKKKKWRR